MIKMKLTGDQPGRTPQLLADLCANRIKLTIGEVSYEVVPHKNQIDFGTVHNYTDYEFDFYLREERLNE